PYTDVAEDAPYYDAVVWAYENGIASDGSTFEPDSACTRGQVMAFLWRAKGSPEPQTTESPFSDVSSADWFYKPALWAYENGVATSAALNPGNPCTNGEALTFLWRAEGKPAAAVYSSPMALTAPDKYFTRPVAWAETNGLFSGADFDPAAPCSRADLMTYLYWVTEEWAFTEEAKTVQAEYEQIINDAQLYEVHGSGLCFADYVDVDGDGKVELLTIGFGKDIFTATVTVYANIDGHAGKFCEGTVESYFWKENGFSICKVDGGLRLHTHGKVYLQTWGGDIEGAEEHQFFKIEKGNFALEDGLSIGVNGVADEVFNYVSQKAITADECKAILQKYTDEKGPFTVCRTDPNQIGILDRGLLPTAEEYQLAYWTAVNPAYAAVLKGDFSAFAGNYIDALGGSDIAMDKNGVLTGDWVTSQKPISITVNENGIIHCLLMSENTGAWDEDGYYYTAYYEIFPAGLGHEWHYSSIADDTRLDKSKIQLWYTRNYDEWSPISGVYYKAS
ncbi:MAG: S-layer homology domain-containing protein, partial [Oscillospiraceae bacterium]|nr:S-layer homology domain-containing protein [Oscillospiraceae bacterium]